MIAVIEGVRIDSTQFPATYAIRMKIRNIAINFRQPIPDLLQDTMIKELELTQHPTEKQAQILSDSPEHLQNYLHKSMYNSHKSICQRTRETTSLESVQGWIEGAFVTGSRKSIYIKMFIDEMFHILQAKDTLLYGILRHKAKHLDKSWSSIHKAYYAKRMGKTWFKECVRKINVEAGKLAEHNTILLGGVPAGRSRLTKYGILCDTGAN